MSMFWCCIKIILWYVYLIKVVTLKYFTLLFKTFEQGRRVMYVILLASCLCHVTLFAGFWLVQSLVIQSFDWFKVWWYRVLIGSKFDNTEFLLVQSLMIHSCDWFSQISNKDQCEYQLPNLYIMYITLLL